MSITLQLEEKKKGFSLDDPILKGLGEVFKKSDNVETSVELGNLSPDSTPNITASQGRGQGIS